jgi:EAL and modified HD-GYP domain-containing signal transduction protein
MSAKVPKSQRFIGRQAVLDQKMFLYGYELLFRDGSVNAFSGDVEDATNQMIDSCLSMAACSSTRKLFVNCTYDALVSGRVRLLPSRTVVLELQESVKPDAELLDACKELKYLGFRLALDDFRPDESRVALTEIADFVKVDFRASGPTVRQEIYDIFRHRKVTFVAEKIETLNDLRIAQAEGHSLFQGYFHSRPEVISERQIVPSKSAYLQLIVALSQSPLDMTRVEHLILMEPALCYRLLRLANSALYGSRNRVSTVQAALNAVGEDAFRKLLTVVLATKLSDSGVNVDAERAVERAFFCESLATILNENPAELYMLGMLSMMDRMLSIPMGQLVEFIPISTRLQEALLGSTKGIGRVLELCRYQEEGGDAQALVLHDSFVPNSAAYYFEALLAAGNTLHAIEA